MCIIYISMQCSPYITIKVQAMPFTIESVSNAAVIKIYLGTKEGRLF